MHASTQCLLLQPWHPHGRQISTPIMPHDAYAPMQSRGREPCALPAPGGGEPLISGEGLARAAGVAMTAAALGGQGDSEAVLSGT